MKNNTGGASSGNATNVVIVGVDQWGVPLSETLVFATTDLATLADQASVTKTTSKAFLRVFTITPSVAQPAAWQHSAGTAAQTAGDRIFAIEVVTFNERELDRQTADWLSSYDTKWRTRESSTPDVWIPWGEKRLRMWKTPNSTDDIYLEGYATPDPLSFAKDTDTLSIEEDDQFLVPMFAAVMVQLRGSQDEALVKASMFGPQLEAGWKAAHKRIHGIGGGEIIFGRGAPDIGEFWPPHSKTIATLP
jgi:hypothetical protein